MNRRGAPLDERELAILDRVIADGVADVGYPELAVRFRALAGRPINHQTVWSRAKALGVPRVGAGRKWPRVGKAVLEARTARAAARRQEALAAGCSGSAARPPSRRTHLGPEQWSLLDGLFREFPRDSDALIAVKFTDRTGRLLHKKTVLKRRWSLGLPARQSGGPLEPAQWATLGRLTAEAAAEHIGGCRARRVARRFAAETGRRIAVSTAFNFARRSRDKQEAPT